MKKLALTLNDKVINVPQEGIYEPLRRDALTGWVYFYVQLLGRGAPQRTQKAKESDLADFVNFFRLELGDDAIDLWVPAVTKHYQQHLLKTISSKGQTYKATTINRRMATLRHFARWVHQRRPFAVGNPLEGVKDLKIDEPDWRGLSPRQLLRLKTACEQRIHACQRADQNPLLEAAVFYALLQTGLRESELVALDVGQYHHKGFHAVMRTKNKRISSKVPVPQDARAYVDRYLATRPDALATDPLFLSRTGQRLHVQDVRRLCHRILQQAQAHLPADEHFKLNPHMLRHTFLKRVTDKHGVHFAQQMSGNVSIREIFRYAKPSQEEIDHVVEEVFQ